MSRIGKKPVELPSGVSASVSGQTIEVKGPKGDPQLHRHRRCDNHSRGNYVRSTPRGKSKRARQQWGMTRTMVANMVTGVPPVSRKSLRSAVWVTGHRCRAMS